VFVSSSAYVLITRRFTPLDFCGQWQLSHTTLEGIFLAPSILLDAGANVCRKEHPMMDVLMLAMGLGFFALSVGYAVACDRL